jgi:hypothetical protein
VVGWVGEVEEKVVMGYWVGEVAEEKVVVGWVVEGVQVKVVAGWVEEGRGKVVGDLEEEGEKVVVGWMESVAPGGWAGTLHFDGTRNSHRLAQSCIGKLKVARTFHCPTWWRRRVYFCRNVTNKGVCIVGVQVQIYSSLIDKKWQNSINTARA